MGAEGSGDINIGEAIEAGSLIQLIRDGEVRSTVDNLIQRYGPAVMEPRSDGSSLLHSFALLGSYDAVSLLLEKGATTSILQSDGSTILHSVVRTTEPSQDQNRSKVLSLILDSGSGVPVNHRNSKGWTALKLAARKGLEQCVEVLLDHGADPNISDNEGYLPLHNAVGNIDVVKLLVSSTTGVNRQTQQGETPLYIAVDRGITDCALMLLEHGADPNIANKDGITPLFLASRGGSVSLVRELLRRKADPNCTGAAQRIAPLHWAAHKESTEIALLLIEFGANIQLKDKEGRTPLSLASQSLATKMIAKAKLRNQPLEVAPPTQMTALDKAMGACCGGNVPALRSLLQSGVNVNQICDPKNSSTLLHMAAYCGQVTVVVMLLSNGADWRLKDKDGDTILHFVCMKDNANGNHDATLKYLLSTPASSLINAQNSRGDTPLLVAIRCQYASRAKLLLQHDADVMISNNKKELPLHRASCKDHNIEMVLYLADLVPDINIQDGDGWTALMYASRSNCLTILKYLLQRKADPNLEQSSGYTALHLAAQENLPEACRVLLSSRANPNVFGGEQKVTPLHIAAHKGFKEVCQVLVENGADFDLKDSDNDTPLSLTDDEDLKSIMMNAHSTYSRGRSNSQTLPAANCGSDKPPVLQKTNSKEEEKPHSAFIELMVKLDDKEQMLSKLVCNVQQLKEEKSRCETRIWSLEGELRQKEMALRLANLPEDEQACRQRWWMLDLSDFQRTDQMLNNISEDSLRFWDVYMGTFRMMDVVVKEIHEEDSSPEIRKCFIREVEQLSHLHCPSIVQFFGAFCDSKVGKCGLVIEYMPNGNLSDLLHVHKVQLEKLEKMRIIRDVVRGMCYLHSFPILVRSLRPKNVLLGENYNAKLSDFGFSETKKMTGYIERMKSNCKKQAKELPTHVAPEVIERNEFSTASDVYSFGMLIYEIATCKKPFSDIDHSQKMCIWAMKIIMGARPPIPPELPKECQEVMAKCWHTTPSARPTFQYLQQHIAGQIHKYQEEINKQ